jgi:hypothetical protein
VCVACSQLEKVRAAMLDIKRKHITLDQNYLENCELQGGEVQVQNPEEISGYMQKQLNICIRHHQEIKR